MHVYGVMLWALFGAPNGVDLNFINDEDFYRIVSVRVDAKHRIYAVDNGEHTVWIFDAQGNRLKSLGRKGQGPGEFDGPSDVAFLADGRILVVDAGQRRLQLFAESGTLIRLIPIAEQPLGQVALRPDDTLILTRSQGFYFRINSRTPAAGRFGHYNLKGERLGGLGQFQKHKNPLLSGILNGGTIDLFGGGIVQASLCANELIFIEGKNERRVRYPIAFEPREPEEKMETSTDDDGNTSIQMSVISDQICQAMVVRNNSEVLLLRAMRSEDESPNQLVRVGLDGKIIQKWDTEFQGKSLALSPKGNTLYMVNDLESGMVISKVVL